MSTVLVVNVDGVDFSSDTEKIKINAKVESKVKEIITKLKISHTKFEDPDFGPTESDEYGAISLYGNAPPNPAGSKYPSPESLKWERPQYDDGKFGVGQTEVKENEVEEEEYDDEFGGFGGTDDQDEIWCKHGKLFLDGSSSGDVIQGQLGDCWFLSALAVMGAHEDLLDTCFWRRDSFREHGVYVLRFFKDCNIIFVIIDDRIPVKVKDGRVIFAGNKDPNELWVPLIEKGYAKLHGCYKALIGGFTHNGLADMTGFCPRLIVMREGYLGYSEPYSDEDVWALLTRFKAWRCLMGCSIQSNPQEKAKVEADAGNGLHMGHAYSLLDIGEIDVRDEKDVSGRKMRKERLVKVRNPWGRGEWEGSFGDRSEERETLYKDEIERVFFRDGPPQERAEVDFNDGTFFMTFKDWRRHFTSLFVALRFPVDSWSGKRTQGVWKGDCGGNREMGSWLSNPKVKLRIEADSSGAQYKQAFVGIYTKDSRLTMGFDYYKDPLYATPLAFDIVTREQLTEGADPKQRSTVRGALKKLEDAQLVEANTGKAYSRAVEEQLGVLQPPYNFGTTQIELFLRVDTDYFIVPSLYKRNQPGTFFLNVFVDSKSFSLEGGQSLSSEQRPMVVGSKARDTDQALKMSVAQFYEKKELIRERIVSEAKRLGLSYGQIEKIFTDVMSQKADAEFARKPLTRGAFKKRMMDLGFALADFPDDDLVILDTDNDGTISPHEFLAFFKEGLAFSEQSAMHSVGTVDPAIPVDDLLYKAVDLAGQLTVKVSAARYVREATTWFNAAAVSQATERLEGASVNTKSAVKSSGPAVRTVIKYDPDEALVINAKNAMERAAQLESLSPAKPNIAPPFAQANELGDDVDGDQFDSASSLPRSPLKGGHKERLTAKALDVHSMGGVTAVNRAAHDSFSVVSGMSVTLREATQKAGMEAASRLHSDPLLQKAEINRTRSLGALRSHKTHKVVLDPTTPHVRISAPSIEESVLRKRSKPTDRSRRRDVTRDREVMMYLGIAETLDREETALDKDGIATRLATPFDGSQTMGRKDAPFPSTTAMEVPKLATKSLTARDLLLHTASTVSFVTEVNAAAVPLASRYREVVGDLWDYLLDCVITISLSRPRGRVSDMSRALHALKRRQINADSFLVFNPAKSPLAAPNVSAIPSRVVSGHAPTPRNARKTPGYASVTTQQAASKQKSVVLGATERLQKIEEEERTSYEEIFRRLLLVPVTSAAELEGDMSLVSDSLATDSNAYLRSLFKRFDKNLNGSISRDEFRQAMGELNVEVSAEDCGIFFNRFGNHTPFSSRGGQNSSSERGINWMEFLSFFKINVLGSTNSAASSSSSDHGSQSGGSSNLISVLSTLKGSLERQIAAMTAAQASSIEGFLAAPAKTSHSPVASARSTFKLPENAIFQDLSAGQAKVNADKLLRLGVQIGVEDMARISRVFQHSVAQFMAFLALPGPLDMHAVLDLTDSELAKGIALRCGLNSGGSGKDQSDAVAKLWTGIAPNKDSLVPFDDIAVYLEAMLADGLARFDPATREDLSPRTAMVAAATSVNKTAPPAVSSLDGLAASPVSKLCIMGVGVDVLCRVVTDTLVYSTWNRQPLTGSKDAISVTVKLLGALSFSGLDAYVRNERMNYIDRKLKYLMQLETNYSSPSSYLLVHVYVNRAQDELVVLAHDPVSGEVHKLSVREDLRALPVGEKLRALFPLVRKMEEAVNNKGHALRSSYYNSDATYLYNPWDTPAEDAAVSEFLSRLKIVRGRSTASSLILGEDARFTSQLKALLDSSSLPFFCVLNDLTLSFSVDVATTQLSASVRSVVFGSLRSQKALLTFLVNVSSSLNVVISTYNCDSKEVFRWAEMLAHLTNYRNPFVTVQLLPRFVEPEQYIYVPEEDSSFFSGEEADDPLAVQRGPVDLDGAPHPVWNTTFRFSFQPPQLTSCKVLSTDIAKMRLDDVTKYVIVMVRESKRLEEGVAGKVTFRFLTIYDPRSATEYQCGVQKGCSLHDCMFGKQRALVDLEHFLRAVSDATDTDKLILGPAITPRVVINIFNQNGFAEELLGTSQVSISSVLSGSGLGERQWTTATYKLDLDNGGRPFDAKAGDIELELSFRKQAEIDAQLASEEKYAQKVGTQRATCGDEATITSPRGVNPVKTDISTIKNKVPAANSKQGDKDYAQLLQEYTRLKEKVRPVVAATVESSIVSPTSTYTSVMAIAPATVDETLVEELSKARAGAEKLQQERDAADRQRVELEQEIQALRDSVAKQAMAATSTILSNKALAADPALADQLRILTLEHETLQTEAEQLRAFKLQAERQGSSERLTTSGRETPDNVIAPRVGLVNSSSYESLVGAGADFVQITEESVIATVHGILSILLARHEKKGGQGSPLDSFQRLLVSYSKGDGQANCKDILTTLSDLLIDISTEQCVRLMRAVGTSNKSTVLVSAVVDFFRSELASLPTHRVRKRPASGKLANTQSFVEEDRSPSRGSATQQGFSNTMPIKLSHDVPPSEARVKKNRPASASSSAPRESVEALPDKPAEALRSKSSSNVIRETTSRVSQEPSRKQTAEFPEQKHATVDWLAVELPSGWERRLHAATHRHVYVHHESKKTQWNHPLDPRRQQKQKQRATEGREEQKRDSNITQNRVPEPDVQRISGQSPKEVTVDAVTPSLRQSDSPTEEKGDGNEDEDEM